ncbi:MAG: DNA-processing protein DprA [Oscillospiraceae bacterium]|nr:DNA-processing protein DprA [Oscillospiraceae bacterium]
MSALKYWVWLSALTGLKPARRLELLDQFGDPEKIYYADEGLFRKSLFLSDAELSLVMDKSLDKAERILEKSLSGGISILCFQDAVYPQRLRNIFDPPVVLYLRGRLPAVDETAVVGVVGTRKATLYGVHMAKKLGFELTKGGGLVATGLAEGVDSAAAKGALLAGGPCIGVLGCAIDSVYPKFNTALYDDMALAGALISEYPPGDPIARKNFPERNRIISGLSLGVVVVEAPLRSGALITAALALEQGREVFAVPGNADVPDCFGSNALIRDGAQLVSCGWDVLADFAPQFAGKLSETDAKKLAPGLSAGQEDTAKSPAEGPETGQGFAKLRVRANRKGIDNEIKRDYIDLREQLSGLSERQLKIVSVIEKEPAHIDDIIEKTALSAPEVLSELTILQIKGFVNQARGKRFSLNISSR